MGAQVKFCRFLALKTAHRDEFEIHNKPLTPAVDTVSTFPSKCTSVMGRRRCRRWGFIPIYFFPSAAFMLTVNLSGSRCPVALSKAKA